MSDFRKNYHKKGLTRAKHNLAKNYPKDTEKNCFPAKSFYELRKVGERQLSPTLCNFPCVSAWIPAHEHGWSQQWYPLCDMYRGKQLPPFISRKYDKMKILVLPTFCNFQRFFATFNGFLVLKIAESCEKLQKDTESELAPSFGGKPAFSINFSQLPQIFGCQKFKVWNFPLSCVLHRIGLLT